MPVFTDKLKRIETVIIGFFLIRLIGITLPPLETWHSWRQSLTNMMARNMVEIEFSLLYPRIDMAGSEAGIIGSEFPFFQTLIAGCSILFGDNYWAGRLINLVVSSFAVLAFFNICKRWWNERTAWYATVIFLSSLWFAFSRKAMPDTFAVSLVIIGIFFFQRFLDRSKWWLLIVATLFITLGGLCKIPAVFLFGIIVPLWLSQTIRLQFKILITIAVSIASTIICWWYFYWVPYLVETYHFPLYFPKGLVEGWLEIRPFLFDFTKQFYFGALRSYIVIIALLVGVFTLKQREYRLTAIGLFILTVIFLLFSLKTGSTFPMHNYYVLPFVPVMAVIAALGLQRFNARWSVALLLLIVLEGILNQISDFRIKDEVRYRLTLEAQVNQFVPKGERIIIHSGSNPEWMYYYHRKGWSLQPQELADTAKIKAISDQGGNYVVVDKRNCDLTLPYKKVGETADLAIWKVQ